MSIVFFHETLGVDVRRPSRAQMRRAKQYLQEAESPALGGQGRCHKETTLWYLRAMVAIIERNYWQNKALSLGAARG